MSQTNKPTNPHQTAHAALGRGRKAQPPGRKPFPSRLHLQKRPWLPDSAQHRRPCWWLKFLDPSYPQRKESRLNFWLIGFKLAQTRLLQASAERASVEDSPFLPLFSGVPMMTQDRHSSAGQLQWSECVLSSCPVQQRGQVRPGTRWTGCCH